LEKLISAHPLALKALSFDLVEDENEKRHNALFGTIWRAPPCFRKIDK
jgi:hypothetical protein